MKVFTGLLFALLLCVAAQGKPSEKSSNKRVVCYFASWAGYRNGRGVFTPEDTDPTICTHAMYAFAGLDATTAQLVPLDPWNDLTSGGGKGFYNRFVGLKKINPKLKVLLSVGGWNEGSSKYSMMASNKAGRARFISSAVNLLKEHGFDGMDLMWMYPGSRGGAPADKQNYALLIAELRAAFDANNLILVGTLPSLPMFLDPGYDINAVVKNLEFINILSYDYRGNWERTTGLAAPLHYEDELVPDVADTIEMYLSKGVPSEMIVMGIPAFAQTQTLRNPDNNGIGAPATGPGQQGPLTQQPGFMGYHEIVEALLSEPDLWEVKRNEESNAPYAYNWLLWASYDDIESVKTKADYIVNKNLGGAMVFTIDTDDFHGSSGTVFPIVRTLYKTLVQ